MSLNAWSYFVRDPMHRLWDPQYGCGVMGCCPGPQELRAILQAVVHVLPPKDAGLLRRRIAVLDEQW